MVWFTDRPLVFLSRDMLLYVHFPSNSAFLSCLITVTVDTFVANLIGRVTCRRVHVMSLVLCKALADSLHEHRNEILWLDCSIYPSTSIKSGISTKELVKNHVAIRAKSWKDRSRPLKKRLLQTELEAAFDKLNSRTGGALTQLCRPWNVNYAQWRTDVCFDQKHGFPHGTQIWDLGQVDKSWICDFSNTASARDGGFALAVRVASPARTRRGC